MCGMVVAEKISVEIQNKESLTYFNLWAISATFRCSA